MDVNEPPIIPCVLQVSLSNLFEAFLHKSSQNSLPKHSPISRYTSFPEVTGYDTTKLDDFLRPSIAIKQEVLSMPADRYLSPEFLPVKVYARYFSAKSDIGRRA